MNLVELLQSACELFEKQKYDQALEGFVACYNAGYEREWILENIYSCYVQPNDAAFRKTYEFQNKGMMVPYDECLLDFIPYKEGQYYIYDKELQLFQGIIEVPAHLEMIPNMYSASLKSMEFSPIAIGIEWDFRDVLSVLSETRKRPLYVVCKDIRRGLSFCKLPELDEYLRKIRIFGSIAEYQNFFHKNTAEYLPRLFLADEELDMEFNRVLEEEHSYRLTPEGRTENHVLLTIGIPTCNRGHLVLKLLEHLRNLPYDSEIEFAISKNGSDYYQEEYRQILLIRDSRINYVGCDKELMISENWQNVIKIAHGKFVLLVSDEDDIVFSAMEHYLNLLHSHPELALVRAKSRKFYRHIEDGYFKKGEEALFQGFLQHNYVSGEIYNREIFLNINFEYWDKKYKSNLFYGVYPHQWWPVLLCLEGDYATVGTELIEEGTSVIPLEVKRKKAEERRGKEEDINEDSSVLLMYSTYDSRIEQFTSGTELIWGAEKLTDTQKAHLVVTFINKTLYLMEMVYTDYHYKQDEFWDKVDELVRNVIEIVENAPLSQENKERILNGTKTLVEMTCELVEGSK